MTTGNDSNSDSQRAAAALDEFDDATATYAAATARASSIDGLAEGPYPMKEQESNAESYDFMTGGGEMGRRLRAMDWSTLSLGKPEGWPQSLRSAVSICLNAQFPIAIYWGSELALIYNDAWSPIPGEKHAWAPGRPGREVWPEIWQDIGPLFERVQRTGEGVWQQDQLLPMHRHGYKEECYFNFTFSPIRDEHGRVGGIFNAVVETTFRVIDERRGRYLQQLAEQTSSARSMEEVCERAAAVLQEADADVPFCLFYLLDEHQRARLVAKAGVDLPQKLRPESFAIDEGALWYPEAQGELRVISDLGQYAGCSVQGTAWPEPIKQVLVVPLGGLQYPVGSGFCVVALSPRRALDSSYRSFVERIAWQLSSAINDAQVHLAERRRAEALAELDRAKTTFFSNVSHEFRTPLTLLLGPLQDAAARPSEGLRGAALESAHRNALRLLKLVNTLLDFSRIQANQVHATYAPTDLRMMTEELASVFRAVMEQAGLKYTVDCQPLPSPAFVDRDMWEKIVLNLLSNAFKYTLEGEIHLELRFDGDRALLEVSDTGTGIPADALPHLFERFYRVPNARGRTHEGSGIGLSLVNELVSLHGGTIDVDSSMGQGSRFRVRIPLGAQHLPQERISTDTTVQAAFIDAQAFALESKRWLPEESGKTGAFPALDDKVLFSAPQDPMASPATVLIVDDNADMREYVSRLLGSRFVIIQARDGQAALDLINAGSFPDLVLSDVMMPQLDGFGLLKAIRESPRTQDLPVILLSARAGEESKIEGLDVGADDYLVKPFSARELIARVETHVRLARLRREAHEALKENDRRKDEFLATLAHELRNPLAPIRTAARILSSEGVTASQLTQCGDVIQRQSQSMALLLDDLLDIARISSNKLNLKRELIGVATVIQSAVETARPLIDARGHTLTLHQPKLPITVEADPLRLSQALTNLLTNAAKYTDPNGRIDVAVSLQDGRVVIAVSDNGVGLAPEDVGRVFTMFSQVDSASERAQGGLGIGLALVRGIVELHGGEVLARSEGLGRGSEFTIGLPTVTAGEKTENLPAGSSRTVGRHRILVADDNADARDTLRMLLELSDHDVRTTGNGQETLSVCAAWRPELAILDIGMPDMTGYDVAAQLRREPSGNKMVLVALTGWGDEKSIKQAREAGFDHHLTKPVDLDKLENLIAQFLGESLDAERRYES